MTTREVDGGSTGLPTLLKAALPVLPGLNLVPGVAKRGGPLPDLTLVRRPVVPDPDHVTAYAEVCGFPARQHLPLTYPHLLAFGLHMAIMTDGSFPFPAIGTVHVGNSITQNRRLGPTEPLAVSASAQNLRPHPKGLVFDLVTTVTAEDEPVWTSISHYLRMGAGDRSVAAERDPLDIVPAGPATWRLPGDLGRRYAAVSGDHNPIHLYPLTAKAFGFPRQIAHGMWTMARCLAALDNRLPDAVTVRVEFKKPVFLPGRVAFGSRITDDLVAFSLTRPDDGAPHLAGRATPA